MNDTIQLADPAYAWLFAIVGVLAALIARRGILWRRDARAMRRRRLVPVPERISLLGPWPFWVLVLGALTLSILALARPQARTARSQTASIDLIVLQDGSASMHVRDVGATRWQRSMQFVRTLAESLEWPDDRMALAVFARIAAPQIRLTRDPNTIFFFLDHLHRESPFPLGDDTTWDTNIALGLSWGMRLLERDEELNGASDNAKAFVLVSDGQAWSGEVEASLARARERDIPVFVVGVGTPLGGVIPEPPTDPFAAAARRQRTHPIGVGSPGAAGHCHGRTRIVFRARPRATRPWRRQSSTGRDSSGDPAALKRPSRICTGGAWQAQACVSPRVPSSFTAEPKPSCNLSAPRSRWQPPWR